MDVFDAQRRALAAEVEKRPATDILRDPAAVAAELFDQLKLEPPVLREGEIEVDTQEAQIDVSQDFNRAISDRSRPFYMPGIRVTYFVPFDGDAAMFRFSPSTFTFNPPRGVVKGRELHFTYTVAGSDVAATKARFQKDLRDVKQWLEWVRRDSETFNSSFRPEVEQSVTGRRGRLERAANQTEQLGFKKRQPANAPPTSAKKQASRSTSQRKKRPRV